MLVIANLGGNRLLRFRFSHEVPPDADDPEALLNWVLDDYPARRDEQWRVPPALGQAYVLKRLLLEEKKVEGDVIPPIRALGYYSAGGLYPFVVPHLASSRREVRLAAVVALGSMGHKGSTAALTPELDDPDPEIRAAAAIALSKFIDPESLAALERAEARDPSVAALTHTGHARRAALLAERFEDAVRVMVHDEAHYEDLAALAPFVREPMQKLLLESTLSTEERRRTIKVLGLAQFRKGVVVDKICEYLGADDTPRDVRTECVRFVSRIRATSAVPLLCVMLDDAEPWLRHELIEALGWIADSAATGALLNQYELDGDIHRHTIEVAIWRLGHAPSEADISAWSAGQLTWDAQAIYVFDEERLSLALDHGALGAALTSEDSGLRLHAFLLAALVADVRDIPLLAAARQADPSPLIRQLADQAHRILVAKRDSVTPPKPGH